MPNIHRRRRLLVTAPKERVLDRAVAYWDTRGRPRSGIFGKVEPYASGPLVDLARNGHTAQFGSAAEAVIDYDYDDAVCLKLPGTASNYASIPDSVPLSVTGDIDIQVLARLDGNIDQTTSAEYDLSFIHSAHAAAPAAGQDDTDNLGIFGHKNKVNLFAE